MTETTDAVGAHVGTRTPGPPVTAQDGIVVRPIDVSPCAHLALAEGSLEPGRIYGVHAHLTLEQVTYVLAGRIRAATYDADLGAVRACTAAAGESVVTPPGHTLQLTAAGGAPARALFITSPPYPPDHSDTVTLDAHRPLRQADTERLAQRR